MACISAMAQGVSFPMIALPYSKMIEIFPREPKDSKWQEDINFYVMIYVYIAILSFVSVFLQVFLFMIVGEGLTLRLRKDCFQKVLSMPGYWFDIPKNSPGSLSTKLSSDAYTVHFNTTTIFGQTFYCLSSFATGIILAFFGSWRLSLVALAIAPLIFFSGYFALQAQRFLARPPSCSPPILPQRGRVHSDVEWRETAFLIQEVCVWGNIFSAS